MKLFIQVKWEIDEPLFAVWTETVPRDKILFDFT